MTRFDPAAWAAYQAANRRAADAYAEQPLCMADDKDTRSCNGCNHRTARDNAYCDACRTYGPVIPNAA